MLRPFVFSILALLTTKIWARYTSNSTSCKVTPSDPAWPSPQEWQQLNASISGALIQSRPIASACFDSNPFNTTIPCDVVSKSWTEAMFHAAQPESISFPVFANNSCSPPDSMGALPGRGCTYGAYPRYIVNATTEEQIEGALVWAAKKNIRVIIKGTGHDLLGRSTGANSLSIWTHHFQRIAFDENFIPTTPNARSGMSYDAIIVGSGQTWNHLVAEAGKRGKVVVGGGTPTVGLGGYIGGGGHGPLTFKYGMAADNVVQVKVVLPEGRTVIANDYENEDIFWAIRGGGGGNFGVVTEFVLKLYPTTNVTLSQITAVASNATALAITAGWSAAATLISKIPALMDAGVTGTFYTATGLTAVSQFISVNQTDVPNGPLTYFPIFSYGQSPEQMNSLIEPIIKNLTQTHGALLDLKYASPTTFPTYASFFSTFELDGTIAYEGIMSSRLLGKAELTQHSAQDLTALVQKSIQPQNPDIGAIMVMTMVGGKGPAGTPKERRGALIDKWRDAYVHAVINGAFADTSKVPQMTLDEAGAWVNGNSEKIWESWKVGGVGIGGVGDGMGSYMNEANLYDPKWREHWFGGSYARLVGIKKRVDANGVLYVKNGAGSEEWVEDFGKGTLCRA